MAGLERLLLVGALIGGSWACGDSRPPTAPSPAGGDARAAELVIEGPDQIAPNSSASYRASARFSNGVTLDVTGLAVWAAEPGHCPGCPTPLALAVAPGGTVTAVGQGDGRVTAAYDGLQAAKDIIALSEGKYRLIGQVRAVDSQAPVANVRVAALSESVVEVSTLTSAAGHYRLYGVSGVTTVLATKDGFLPRQEWVTVASHGTLDLELPPPRPEWAVDRTAVLTIGAAADCPSTGEGALPEIARERRYIATISDRNGSLFVKLSGAQFALAPPGFGGTGGDAFHGIRTPSALAFSIVGYYGYYWELYPYPDVVEQISSTQFFVFGGRAELRGASMTGTLDGTLGVFSGDLRSPGVGAWNVPGMSGECTSARHTFRLVP